MFRLDRNAFSIHSHATAGKNRAYWLTKTPAERLAAAWYLICAAWNLDPKVQHRLDRTCFSMRKQGGDE
jgi:hypothetical protein